MILSRLSIALQTIIQEQVQRIGVAWHWLATPILLFGITRLGILLVAYLSVALFPYATDPAPYHLRGTDNVLLDVFGSRWDTGFYVNIVEEGYRYRNVELPSIAFFPLLPLGMRALLPIFGDAVISGIFLSNAALLAATILFYRLVSDTWDKPIATRATWYLLIFPAAFFGSAIYSESLFLLMAIGALYFARQNRWYIAGLFACAGGLTRLIGIAIAPMLLFEWLQQRQANKAPSPVGLPLALAAPTGTALYMLYLWRPSSLFPGPSGVGAHATMASRNDRSIV